tara:strand:- start:2365 stop:4212 length:1848 start_codon:yes stop_codon:yes gene_type:complete
MEVISEQEKRLWTRAVINSYEKKIKEVDPLRVEYYISKIKDVLRNFGSIEDLINNLNIINQTYNLDLKIEEMEKEVKQKELIENQNNNFKTMSPELRQIVNEVTLKQVMEKLNFETGKNPTECVWHDSSSGKNFSFNEKMNVWHCFNCGKGGNIFTLVQEHYKIGFIEAKKWLIDTFNIKIKKSKYNTSAGNLFFDKMALAEKFLNTQPLFYDNIKLWWIWNFETYKWEVIDEIDICNKIYDNLNFNTVKHQERNEMLCALQQVSRRRKPKEPGSLWVQFHDEIVDVSTGDRFQATPEYFMTNPLPYPLGGSSETPTMDKIFEEWVGEENVETLYEIIAYCMIPDYPIQRIFTFIGEGMNGKSKFLDLLTKFIGHDNSTSTELDILLNSRFEITKLYKKLVCIMGETNFNEITQTSILKKLTGGDLIGFEFKNKNPFDAKNYAKIIIATNNLPATTDKTIGFYRRWLIIDFPNRFSEKKDILTEIPEMEYHHLGLKCINKLIELLSKRSFSNEGSIEQRIKKYEDRSNPFEKFIDEMVEEDLSSNIFKWEFKKKLNDWCKENRFRSISDTSIGVKMKGKDIRTIKISSDNFEDGSEENGTIIKKRWNAWEGLRWK